MVMKLWIANELMKLIMPSVYTSLRRPHVCVIASSVQNGMYSPSGHSVIAIMLTKSHPLGKVNDRSNYFNPRLELR